MSGHRCDRAGRLLYHLGLSPPPRDFHQPPILSQSSFLLKDSSASQCKIISLQTFFVVRIYRLLLLTMASLSFLIIWVKPSTKTLRVTWASYMANGVLPAFPLSLLLHQTLLTILFLKLHLHGFRFPWFLHPQPVAISQSCSRDPPPIP